MSKIFIFSGSPQSGKDTFINFVKEYSEEEVISFSSIDYIKWLCETHLNISTKEKTPKLRKFLSEFKKILTEYNDFPFNQCVGAIEGIQENQHLVLQIREKSEIDKIKKLYPETLVVLVQAGDIKPYGNPSDDNVNEIEYDVVIYNYGDLGDLSKTAKWFTKAYIYE